MLVLCEKNTLFFKHCPPPPSKESLKEDLYALPPNKTMADKFFVGLYDCENLVAICDIIKGYPNEKTILIGLLMLDIGLQGQGLGSKITLEMFEYFLKRKGIKMSSFLTSKATHKVRPFGIKWALMKLAEKLKLMIIQRFV